LKSARRKRSNLSTAFFKATQIKRDESDFQSFTKAIKTKNQAINNNVAATGWK